MTRDGDPLVWSTDWTDRKVIVSLRQGAEVRFIDKCDPASDLSRRRLFDHLKAQLPALDLQPLETRLLAMAADGPPKPAKETRLVVPPNPDAWNTSVAGDQLLDEILAVVRRHVVLAEHAAHATALWVVHSYVFDRFHYSPRLLVSSPDKRCGKSLLLRFVAALAARPLLCESISPAALYRTVEKYQPTLILDEADTFLAGRNINEDLRGILNAGFESGGCVLRCVGDESEPTPFRVFGPLALGMIGKPPGTVEDRSVLISMRRKVPGETVEKVPPGRSVREWLEDTRRRIVRWAADHADALAAAVPHVPPQLDDRSADCWYSLLAIADAARGTWPERARRAAIEMAKGRDGVDSIALMLLADLRVIFHEHRVDRLQTQFLLQSLVRMEERPWPDYRNGKAIDARQLAKQLEPFGVRPDKWNGNGGTERGYRAADLVDTWSRYLSERNTDVGHAMPPPARSDAACTAEQRPVERHDHPPLSADMAGRGATMAGARGAANSCESGPWREVADACRSGPATGSEPGSAAACGGGA